MKTLSMSKNLKKFGIYVVLVVLIIAFSIATPKFLTVSNILNVAREAAMLGVASVGMIFVMIIGGIDLSVGSMVTFVNIFVAYLMVNSGVNPFIAAVIGISSTTLIGLFNGWVIANIKIPALIATLATQIIFEGAAYIIAGAHLWISGKLCCIRSELHRIHSSFSDRYDHLPGHWCVCAE